MPIQVASSLSFLPGLDGGEGGGGKLFKSHFYCYLVIRSNFSSSCPQIPLHTLLDFFNRRDLFFKRNKCTLHFHSWFWSNDFQQLHGWAFSTFKRWEMHSFIVQDDYVLGEPWQPSTLGSHLHLWTDILTSWLWSILLLACTAGLGSGEPGLLQCRDVRWSALAMQQLSGSLEESPAPPQLLSLLSQPGNIPFLFPTHPHHM